MNPLISAVVCFGPQRETLGVLDTHSDGCPRQHNSKILTYNKWCALPPKKALATRSPYSLPKYKFLDLPRDVIRSVACFRLCVHTLRCETTTWNPRSSPACDLCEADDDVQDDQHAIVHCTHPHTVSLSVAGDMSPYSQQQEHWMIMVFLHFCTRTTTNYSFYMNCVFYEQASSCTL